MKPGPVRVTRFLAFAAAVTLIDVLLQDATDQMRAGQPDQAATPLQV